VKLNYNPDGWQISDERIRVPLSSPYDVATEHDNISDVEIYTQKNKGGTRLIENTDYTVDYNGEKSFRKNVISFSQSFAGQTLYVWYKTTGDIVEADDINSIEDRLSGGLLYLYHECKGVL